MWKDHDKSTTTGNTTAGTVTSAGAISAFSLFTLGSRTSENPLPVSFISFDAAWKNNFVKLNWVTASEINNKIFYIERSTDCSKWETIGQVAGAGNSVHINSYEWKDYPSFQKIFYYRLKQEDNDGQINYLPVVAVKNTGFYPDDTLVIFPNPVNDEINIKYFSSESFSVTIEITNLTGEIFMTKTENVKAGNNQFVLRTTELPASGNYYFVRLKNQKKNIQAKFIK